MSSNFTKDHLEAIEQAIASGSLVVEYPNYSRRFRSIDELIKARSIIQDALEDDDSSRVSYAEFSKES